jgi:hypothetical protein
VKFTDRTEELRRSTLVCTDLPDSCCIFQMTGKAAGELNELNSTLVHWLESTRRMRLSEFVADYVRGAFFFVCSFSGLCLSDARGVVSDATGHWVFLQVKAYRVQASIETPRTPRTAPSTPVPGDTDRAAQMIGILTPGIKYLTEFQACLVWRDSQACVC